jgi:23S rRNA pseudouridine1911/1915/1917 synthase
MSHNGTSLVGDPLYGSPPQKNRSPHDWARNFPRQALHAKILRFIHPINGQALDFESDLPEDMNQLITSLTLLKSE